MQAPPPDDTPLTPIAELGEFGFISRMAKLLGRPDDDDLIVGIGDDAAVYRIGGGRVHVVTADALIEGVHFDLRFMPLQHLGFKALSVNVSDVVAMNATPRFATLTLGLPPQTAVEPMEAFYRGIKQACETYGVVLVGGDVTTARQLSLSVSVIGEADEKAVVYRSGAQPGDLLCVSGPLGGAYAGLKVLVRESKALQDHGAAYQPDLGGFTEVIQQQLAPKARLDVVRNWAELGVRPHALIDISDGLASEVHHLCRLSGVGAIIEAHSLPIDAATHATADVFHTEATPFALYGGEDYELLFAIDPDDLPLLNPETTHVVGTVTEADEGVLLRTPDGEVVPLAADGFQHFGDTEASA